VADGGDTHASHLIVLARARLPQDLQDRGAGAVATTVHVRRVGLEELAAQRQIRHDQVTIVAKDWSELRALVVPSRLLGATLDLVVRVVRDVGVRRPVDRALSAVPLVPQVTWSRLGGGVQLQVVGRNPFDVGDVVAALAGDHSTLLNPRIRPALADRGAEAFVVGNPYARYAGLNDTKHSAGNDLRVVDLKLAATTSPERGGAQAGPELPVVTVADPQAGAEQRWDGEPALVLPPVDDAELNRARFEDATGRIGALRVTEDGFGVDDDTGATVVTIPRAGVLTALHVAALRGLQHVVADEPGLDARALAWLTVQLAAAGVPVVAPGGFSPMVEQHLGAELTSVLIDITPGVTSDAFLREVASVRLARAASRCHGRAARARRLAEIAGVTVPGRPSVTVVLVTKRPSFLAAAVRHVRTQTWRPMQLVLGLHGEGFSEADVRAALAEGPEDVEVVRAPASVAFGEVLQRATEAADGHLVAKFDDDDLYGAEHLWDLILAMEHSGASMVGKPAQYVHLEDRDLLVRDLLHPPERPRRWVAGGTMLLRRDTLWEVGGWSPLPWAVDHALLRKVVDGGGTVYRTHGLGYILRRRSAGHTWDSGEERFLRDDVRRWPWSPDIAQVVLNGTLDHERQSNAATRAME